MAPEHDPTRPHGNSIHLESLERIRRETFLRAIDFSHEIPSTNDRALLLAAGRPETPLLVIAQRQTAGRGRGENRWWAAGGALTFSILLAANDHRLPRARWPQFSLALGLAVSEAIGRLFPSLNPRLKWPNDVYLSDRKACGILVESPANSPESLVAGIGVNVNNSLQNAPADIASTAVSLVDLLGRPIDLCELLAEIVREIESILGRMAAGDDLSPQWRGRCWLSGRQVTVQLPTEQVLGDCQGIEPDGALLVSTPQGPRRFFSGAVRPVQRQ